ncbi:helix-turn-helix domain-containing protein [Oceanobacillus luteolus]|uniref:Helix-turn-helix domain-containing protein n=1 Tax=Oceanobacillus luteolus TaxID=1274358 RepID=A0ABW4HV92_9BACI|nr:helix-turn-helix domain-containing protein [Oceanobacillus luteolus]MCM3741011.1 helix-turn-helix domain-containing protein [Oceanobacillus luteolus]
MQMNVPIQLSNDFIASYEKALLEMTQQVVEKVQLDSDYKPYMNKKEAAQYIGVSFNTFQKLEKMGLPIIEIDGIRLVRKQDIDDFLDEHKNTMK